MSQDHFQESIDTFKVKFEGGNSIDAELFARTINSTLDLVKASARAINPEAFIRLEIKANKEGSFETVIDAVVKYSDTLLTKDNIALAGAIIQGFCDFLLIKAHLKGQQQKEIKNHGKNSTITNINGENITVNQSICNYYFTGNVDQAIIDLAKPLQENNKPITILTKNQELKFKQTDYDNMSVPTVDSQPSVFKENIETIKNCDLTIKRPDLIGKSKWEVIFAGRQVSVKIDDEIFITKIRKGEIKISGGFKLSCDLSIQTEMDSEYNIVNVNYTTIKVHGIKDQEEQLTLFDEKD